ncbi:hypothetical protein M407DRAFT_247103 [Tulasnella calospora MUT 4182]|uniref:Uncharacterized protein n=1 Tax=Tulasnella calospora MUT 4182 TaxID=1051891 RepID=A0A0C3Q1E1_9AGAM|nr:hypothetical protein M407DRAFT_247103 [Tulasnella calospora MUT 4182]
MRTEHSDVYFDEIPKPSPPLLAAIHTIAMGRTASPGTRWHRYPGSGVTVSVSTPFPRTFSRPAKCGLQRARSYAILVVEPSKPPALNYVDAQQSIPISILPSAVAPAPPPTR